jgi:hypothetical protein
MEKKTIYLGLSVLIAILLVGYLTRSCVCGNCKRQSFSEMLFDSNSGRKFPQRPPRVVLNTDRLYQGPDSKYNLATGGEAPGDGATAALRGSANNWQYLVSVDPNSNYKLRDSYDAKGDGAVQMDVALASKMFKDGNYVGQDGASIKDNYLTKQIYRPPRVTY